MSVLLDESFQPRIVYEDECLIAVHKPPRMHSAPGQGDGDLCSWVFECYPEVAKVRGRVGGQSQVGGGLLHRLDFDTSGLVLFARDDETYASLLGQQARGEFYKEYIALSSAPIVEEPQGSRPRRGSPTGLDEADWANARDEDGYRRQDPSAMADLLACTIESSVPSGRSACGIDCAFRSYGPKGARVACLGSPAHLDAKSEGGGRDRAVAGRSSSGQWASTLPVYRSDILAVSSCVQIELGGQSMAGIELRVGLARGFRHQIRAQLAWIGLPIRGDPLYGGASDERLRLYAVAFSFIHPASALSLLISEPVGGA